MIRQHNRKLPTDTSFDPTLTAEEKALVNDVLLTAVMTRRAQARQMGNTLIGNRHQQDVKVLSSAMKKIAELA